MSNGSKVVITGCGVLTTIGANLEEFWYNLCNGNNGYGPLSLLDTTKYVTKIGGEMKNYNPREYIPEYAKKVDCLGKTSLYALSAAYLALKDARLDAVEITGLNAGSAIGTTDGEAEPIEKMNLALAESDRKPNPQVVSIISPHRIAQSIAREFGLGGPVCTITSACTAGNHAIIFAYEKIKSGQAELMLAGGADTFSRKTFTGFNRLGATAPELCMPFEQDRKGMVVSEGAGIVVMESLEHALERKATIYAEVVGYGVSCDAYHMTIPSEEGFAMAMQNALDDAGLNASDIDLIAAHGTGTQANDMTESKVINRIYGTKTAVTANKSVLGHTMGAASALNVITIVLAMRKGIMPKISNVRAIDPSCKINVLTENKQNRIKYGQANGFAFGGNNGVVILKNVKT